MSHQTGIRCNDELKDFIAKSKEGHIRLLKIVINSNEELTLESYKECVGDWNSDYNSYVLKSIDPKLPCFIFYRLDESLSTGFAWLFISWSPDFASVKNKMLYAATKSTLKHEFGAGQIKDELFGTVSDDVSLDGYLKHLKSESAPKPLSFKEEELQQIKQSETRTNITVDTKQKTLQGVMFPLEQKALDHLEEFQKGSIDYLQLFIDLKDEMILLGSVRKTATPLELQAEIPIDKGRYHLYRFKHFFDNKDQIKIVFIYSMPGFTTSIKERMLYSSCKNELLNFLKTNNSIDICKTFEISEANEITEIYLIDEIHPQKYASAAKFDKPKGPTTRGPRRITRQSAD